MHLARLIAYWSRQRGGQIAISQQGMELSWAQFGSAATALAVELRQLGMMRGDRLGCLLPNRPEWCVAFAGAQMAELLFVPLNPMFGPDELRHIADDAGCRFVVSSPALVAKLADHFAVETDDTPTLFDLVSGSAVGPVELFPADLVEAPARVDDDSDAAAICYTSGTTGRPKGAVHSHRTITAMITGLARGYDLTGNEVFLLVAPLSFTGGVICNLAVSLALGATLVLEPGFDPARALELIERHRVTAFGGAAIFWQRLADEPGFEAADLGSLRHGFAGGSPIPPTLVTRFLEKGVGIRQQYGSTETGGGATLPTKAQSIERPEACGTPLIGLDLAIRDEAGVPCLPGTVGEITLRGPQLMLGYWHQPEQTAAVFRDGWYRSGDLGFLNDFGELVVVDRKKNMVISGGVNIYPAEVEAVIGALPGVVECLVLGVPSADWGEELVAIIVVEDRLINELNALLKTRLGSYKTPKRVIQRTEPLPRTSTGKIARENGKAEFLKSEANLPKDAIAERSGANPACLAQDPSGSNMLRSSG